MDNSVMDNSDMDQRRFAVRVKLFALAKQLAGSDEVEVIVSQPVTIGAIRGALARQVGPLASLVTHSMFAVGTSYAPDDTVVRENDQVAMIPPVSGG